jgi:hypothetical protein
VDSVVGRGKSELVLEYAIYTILDYMQAEVAAMVTKRTLICRGVSDAQECIRDEPEVDAKRHKEAFSRVARSLPSADITHSTR